MVMLQLPQVSFVLRLDFLQELDSIPSEPSLCVELKAFLGIQLRDLVTLIDELLKLGLEVHVLLFEGGV